MTATIKQCLEKLSVLSPKDQQWVLNALPEEAKQKLREHLMPPKAEVPPLPHFCEQLAQHSNEYIAIVLNHLNPNWLTLFLDRYDADNAIKTLMLTELTLKQKSLALIQTHFETMSGHLSYRCHPREGGEPSFPPVNTSRFGEPNHG